MFALKPGLRKPVKADPSELCGACVMLDRKPDRTSMSMNELHFGAPLPAGMAAVLSLRLPTPVLSKVMLTAHRYDANEALKDGLVDEIVATGPGSDKCIERALDEADKRKGFAESGVRKYLLFLALALLRSLPPPAFNYDLLTRLERLFLTGPRGDETNALRSDVGSTRNRRTRQLV